MGTRRKNCAGWEDSNNFEEISHINLSRSTFTWKIENFPYYPLEPNQVITSKPFSCSDATWVLEIYPNSQSNGKDEGYVSSYLRRVSSEFEKHNVTYKICFINRFGLECYPKEMTKVYEDSKSYGVRFHIQRDELLRKKKSRVLPNDTLTVYLEMTIGDGISHGPVKEMKEENCKLLTKLSQVFQKSKK